MRVIVFTLLAISLTACVTKPKDDDASSQKITVTGTRIDRSELPSGPKLAMSLNKQNESSNFMHALAGMQSLPQPEDIGDCKGLVAALSERNLLFNIVDANNVVVESEHAIYEYSFDDNSCADSEN